MIDTDVIQAALIAKLKADTALVAFLTSFGAANEIRESQWQGRDFIYPNVRLELGTHTDEGDPPCYSTMPFTVYSYSEKDSSREANQLAGYVNQALEQKNFSGIGFTSGIIVHDGLIAARRVSERVWQAVNLYQVNIYGGVL
jgi:hypothetical protein